MLRHQQTKVLKKHIVDIDKLIKDYIQLLLDSIDDEIVNNIIGHNDEPNENRRTKRVCTLIIVIGLKGMYLMIDLKRLQMRKISFNQT